MSLIDRPRGGYRQPRQLTTATALGERLAQQIGVPPIPRGCMVANRACWTADSRSIVIDLRDDETRFDSPAIVQVDLGDTPHPAHGGTTCPAPLRAIHRDAQAAPCGVPTCSPCDDRVVFIQADPTGNDGWNYCAWHRRGLLIDLANPGWSGPLDARDILPPFTAGALRGGTHLHTFNQHATAIVSTYEDHVLAASTAATAQQNRRCIAVHLLDHPVTPPQHQRNHAGSSFSVLVTRLHDQPQPDSDQINWATGEAWLAGTGNRIAFQGTVCDRHGREVVELFRVELPDRLADLTGRTTDGAGMPRADTPGASNPLARPAVPAGVRQRRLTFTTERKHPGLVGPRHWAVGSPDGSQIGCYLADEHGTPQFWTVASEGGTPQQITHDTPPPTSPFTWHPDGTQVAYHADGSVMLVDLVKGTMRRLTQRLAAGGPTHHACVFSPNGRQIAYLQPVTEALQTFNQLHVVAL